MPTEYPVVVIGAGPQGLAAAAHLAERALPYVVLEAGDRPAAAVAEWAHVRLFSEWPELIDAAAARLLASTGWTAPAGGYPTGGEWVSEYLAPLADALGDGVRYGARVVGVSRQGRDRLVDAAREQRPFTVRVAGPEGEEAFLARAVIDASGTWDSPRPAGADGLPALGERAAADAVSYRIPGPAEIQEFEGKRVVVVGAGHSALGALVVLAGLAETGTTVTWALRRAGTSGAYGGGAADELPARGALGIEVKRLVAERAIRLVTGFRTERIDRVAGALEVRGDDGRVLEADRVIALTGFLPDHSFLSELRLELDVTLQAPPRVAVEVDPNLHSCGSVAATGSEDLAHPERDFYIVGAKSYGRAPTFLALTGYEQVRSVVAALAGDHEAARRNELVLPETGVCGGAGAFDPTGSGAGGACCSPAVASIGAAPTGVRLLSLD